MMKLNYINNHLYQIENYNSNTETRKAIVEFKKYLKDNQEIHEIDFLIKMLRICDIAGICKHKKADEYYMKKLNKLLEQMKNENLDYESFCGDIPK